MSMFSPADRKVPITAPSSSSSTSRVLIRRRSSSTSISIGTSPSGAISSSGVIANEYIGGLAHQVDSVLAQLVGGSHHLSVGLIGALVDDQIGELGGDIRGR